MFEEDWGCSARCLHTMVHAAVQREMGNGMANVTEEPHRHRVPLGLVLLAQGWITHPQLQAALAAQRASGEGRIGDWLIRHFGLPEERIARGLGVQWNCPVLSLQGFSSPRAMALVMPKRFVAEFGLIPVRSAGSTILYVAFQDRLMAAAAFALEQMCGLKVESGLLPTTQMDSARVRLLAADSVSVRMRQVHDTDGLTAALVKLLEVKRPVASRLVRVHQYYWMRTWMEETAIPAPGRLQATAEDTGGPYLPGRVACWSGSAKLRLRPSYWLLGWTVAASPAKRVVVSGVSALAPVEAAADVLGPRTQFDNGLANPGRSWSASRLSA